MKGSDRRRCFSPLGLDDTEYLHRSKTRSNHLPLALEAPHNSGIPRRTDRNPLAFALYFDGRNSGM
jgi:hypothetical protein